MFESKYEDRWGLLFIPGLYVIIISANLITDFSWLRVVYVIVLITVIILLTLHNTYNKVAIRYKDGVLTKQSRYKKTEIQLSDFEGLIFISNDYTRGIFGYHHKQGEIEVYPIVSDLYVTSLKYMFRVMNDYFDGRIFDSSETPYIDNMIRYRRGRNTHYYVIGLAFLMVLLGGFAPDEITMVLFFIMPFVVRSILYLLFNRYFYKYLRGKLIFDIITYSSIVIYFVLHAIF